MATAPDNSYFNLQKSPKKDNKTLPIRETPAKSTAPAVSKCEKIKTPE